eukprot:1397192-Lingulodinium_polyedra.AAC.1
MPVRVLLGLQTRRLHVLLLEARDLEADRAVAQTIGPTAGTGLAHRPGGGGRRRRVGTRGGPRN